MMSPGIADLKENRGSFHIPNNFIVSKKMEEKKIITPRSKVLDVINEYPQLEEILIEYVPAFKKLKNPLLRKTVGRVATLQQAASIGEVKVEDLINRLRREVGQELYSEQAGTAYLTEKPDWFREELIHQTLNASEMLSEGNHPVNQVMADLKSMPSGKIYKLIAPFLPAPLIDKATSLGALHWVVRESDTVYIVYFYKQ